MKLLPLGITTLVIGAVALSVTGTTWADDGPMTRKNVSNTPDLETEHATVRMLPLYVPAQASDGTLLTEGIEYYNAEGTLVETRYEARPLISLYNDGHVEFIEEEGYGGFPGHGQRDAYAAVSLDDGATWKRSNLSQSADRSSVDLRVDNSWVPYPGDVLRTFAASDGNKVLFTWVSKYCASGSPAYSMSDEERDLLAEYLAGTGTIPDAAACTDGDPLTACTYLEDAFSVAGSQGVQSGDDLAEDGYELVGDYPYSCAWAARGVILPPEATGLETSTFVWFKAERLSSGVRSANRPETVCVKGAGCVVTWQEDPDGIRPGHGDGPGEGWSGAIAHHQTDTWYTYIDWNDFGLVSGDGTYGSFYNDTGDLAEWIAANDSGSPKAAVPMSIPMRLTDNYMCQADGDKPFCYIDFDGNGIADFCASSVQVTIETPEGPTQDVAMCITEDGRLMRGNTASTRARLGLHGYSTLGDYSADPAAYPIDSAWFYMAYEENKGLGDICDDGDCEDDQMTDADKRDMGKNVWYHTFDMFTPELVSQGLMLNQPAVYPDDWSDPTGLLDQDSSLGYNFWYFTEDPIYDWQAGLDTATLYQSEISRRPSTMSQDWYDAGPSGLVGLQLWKQGIIRRGGPADVMARRFVIPDGDGGEVLECTLTTTTYELCTTTYEQWQQECHDEEQWVDYEPNPVFKPNPGQCRGDDMPLKCYEFIDLEGNPTNEPGEYAIVEVCDDGAWVDVEYCDVAEETCRADTVCETVDYCEVGTDEGCTVTETSEIVESCDGLDDCECETIVTSAFDPTVDNPYDYANMVCENADGSSAWAFTDGSNPRYVKGFCAAPAINLSGNSVLTGEDCADATSCFDAFPFNDYFDDLDMSEEDAGITKIETWQMYGLNYGDTATTAWTLHDDVNSLDDLSWENPYDMAKGHRGFLAGDMVMAMYAWTPNWKALTDAHSIVNLYVRRSFDGGLTWSTLPGSFTHTNDIAYGGDGATTCEWMGPISEQYPVCVDYAAGEFEQARNVSQLLGTKVTVLDPRFSPTTRSITEASVSTDSLPDGFIAPLYLDDTRDPSRFFMVYETGIPSAYDAGEATPLDLFYSRAIDWGDDYLVWQDTADTSACLPSADGEDEFDLSGFCNEFDAIEGSRFSESGEAAVTASPGGQFFYAVWNQWDFSRAGKLEGADAWFRRVLFLDDYVPPEDDPSGPGGGTGPDK